MTDIALELQFKELLVEHGKLVSRIMKMGRHVLGNKMNSITGTNPDCDLVEETCAAIESELKLIRLSHPSPVDISDCPNCSAALEFVSETENSKLYTCPNCQCQVQTDCVADV